MMNDTSHVKYDSMACTCGSGTDALRRKSLSQREICLELSLYFLFYGPYRAFPAECDVST